MKAYEHLHVDISPYALTLLYEAVTEYLGRGGFAPEEAPLQRELLNFANECRARVQHAAAAIPDISEPATEEDWLA